MAKIYGFDTRAIRGFAAKYLVKRMVNNRAIMRRMKEEDHAEMVRWLRAPEDATAEELLELNRRALLTYLILDDLDFIIAEWLDDYYLPNNRRWEPQMSELESEKIILHLLDTRFTHKEFSNVDIAKGLSDLLIMSFNDMFGEVLPGRSWRTLSIAWPDGRSESFVLRIGEDYRVQWFMENMINESGGVEQTTPFDVFDSIEESHHSDVVVLKISREKYESLGIVNFGGE